jgi:3-dehydroquinate dehydratase-2
MVAEPEALEIGVLHGPNLNLLGRREPKVYGLMTLEAVDARIGAAASDLGVRVRAYQSNSEGALLDRIHEWGERVSGFLVNAGAYTHTSIALRDALVGVGRPFVEVHLTNVHAREEFRHRSMLAPRAVGVVAGFGVESYVLGLQGLVRWLRGRESGFED